MVKPLRLLETGTYRRVGSTELRKADIRVVSATHRSLRGEMVAEGKVSARILYYRLNTFRSPSRCASESAISRCSRGLLSDSRRRGQYPGARRPKALLVTYPFPGNASCETSSNALSPMCDGEEIGVEHLAREIVERGVGGAQHRRRDVRGRTAGLAGLRVRGAGEGAGAHSGNTSSRIAARDLQRTFIANQGLRVSAQAV